MQHLSKKSIFCCLLLATMIVAQFSCSSSPNTASNQPTASPSPTTEASPSPTIAETPAVSTGESAKKPAVGSSKRLSAEKSPPKSPAPVAERPAPPRTFTMESGRVISIFTEKDLSTKNNRSGQTFTASLARAITDGDWVIAKKGAPVEGTI